MLLKVLTGKLTFSSLKPPNLSSCTKQELRDYFENSYELNESVFTGLTDDSVMYTCPDRLRLPLVFYYAHTAVVYVNKLMLAGLLKNRVNLEFETMFETGVDEMSWDDTENYRMGGSYEWPSIDEVVDYRRAVRNEILKVIEDTPLTLPITMENPWWGLAMGMEHERIHLETSSVLIRQLPATMVTKPDGWKYAPYTAARPFTKNPMIRMSGRMVSYGKPKDFPSYGWDNEYGEVNTFVPTFEASKFLISNRDFLEFVQDGGYNRQELWTAEGWKWKQFREAKHPAFWVCDKGCKSGCGADLSSCSHCSMPKSANNNVIIDCLPNGSVNGLSNGSVNGLSNGMVNGVSNGMQNGVSNGMHNGVSNGMQNGVSNGMQNGVSNGHDHMQNGNDQINGNDGKRQCDYRYRALYDVIDMPMDWPVDANYHEAKAYCVWKGDGYRLMGEAEHSAIRANELSPKVGVKSDIIFTSNLKEKTVNHNLLWGSSTPVNMFPPNNYGFHDVFGNVWQWMEDHFNGLCTETHWLYDDFSSPCFDGNHNVILGGSWISTGDEASRFARYAFRRHFFQHAGFRLVRSVHADQQVSLPIKIVKTDVFVLGVGVEEKHIHIDQTKIVPDVVSSTNIQYAFDTPSSLSGILEQEFGFRKALPVVVADFCADLTAIHGLKTEMAFWIGCGAGRGPLRLSETFDKILAVDYSGRFVDAAQKIQKGEELSFSMADGQLMATKLEPSNKADNVEFKQLTWLTNEIRCDNDLVIVTFLERTLQPKAWLLRLWEVTKPDGLLVIVSEDGVWDRAALEQTLNEKNMEYMDEVRKEFSCHTGETTATITLWRRM